MAASRRSSRRAAAHRAPHAELLHLPGGHYAPFLDSHETAVEAERAFLCRHVSTSPAVASVPEPVDG
jgi:hypothetical protein